MAEIGSLKTWRGRFVRYAPLILWIGVIFFLSSEQASMSETSRIIRPVLEFLFPGASEETLQIYHGFIRKFAHFAEYASLAFWLVRAFSGSSVEILSKHKYPVSIALALAIALIDEANQSLVSSRTGSIWDVVLDASGSLAMILFLWIFKVGSEPPAVAGG